MVLSFRRGNAYFGPEVAGDFAVFELDEVGVVRGDGNVGDCAYFFEEPGDDLGAYGEGVLHMFILDWD